MAGKKNQDGKESLRKLRAEAEQKVARSASKTAPLNKKDPDKLVHELQVHQVELEMQNEELRRTQAELMASQERYFDLYDIAPVGYFSISEKGIILEANLTGANLLGAVPRDLRAKRFTSFIHKEDQDVYYLQCQQLFKTLLPQVSEIRMVRKDGSPFWARVEAAPAQDDERGALVCRAVISDITSQKQAEQALQESEEKYRLLIENALEAIFIAQDGKLKFANDRAAELTGYSQQDLISRPVIQFIHPDDRLVVAERYVKRFKSIEIPNINSFRIVCKSGDIKWVELSAALVTWEGRPATLNFLTDVTDRRRLEEEQHRVAKLESLGVLAGGIAHDFNNILTAILGNINLAMVESARGSAIYNSLEQAEKASLRARDLTQQLLTFARGGSPVREITSLKELLRDTVSFALAGSNVKCSFFIPDDLWHAEIDRGQVSQVMHNLVINAQQAMPAGGIIELRAENMALNELQSLVRGLPLNEGKYIRIAVMDHGGGIPAEHLDRIFYPFFTTKQKGSGLGLATSFSIAHRHGGLLSVESKLGTGSTFYLYLPATTEMSTPGRDKKRVMKPLGKARILIMDDEEMVREVAGRMLKQIGYQDIEFAAGGAEAFKLYEAAMESAQPFSVVIMDLTIPGGMGGMETIKKLLEVDPGVRAIVSSGYANEAVMADYKKYGFRGMVAKPYTSGELGKVVHDVIGEIQCRGGKMAG